jgi:hypothetical protein
MWLFERYVNPLDESVTRHGRDIVELRPDSIATLYLGIHVASPHEYQLVLLRDLIATITRTAWDGGADSLKPWFDRLASELSPVRQQWLAKWRIDLSATGRHGPGISLGGFALCHTTSGNRFVLAAFRRGTFRVMGPAGTILLAEEVEPVPPDLRAFHRNDVPLRTLQLAPITDSDMIWFNPHFREQHISVLNRRCFEDEEGECLIRLTARPLSGAA